MQSCESEILYPTVLQSFLNRVPKMMCHFEQEFHVQFFFAVVKYSYYKKVSHNVKSWILKFHFFVAVAVVFEGGRVINYTIGFQGPIQQAWGKFKLPE